MSSPASHAPNEVLIQIFMLALYADIWIVQPETVLGTRVPTKMDTPLPFMLVCRRWHEAASSDTGLWSMFVVSIGLMVSPVNDVLCLPAKFEHILRKSAQHPLTIHLIIAQDGPYNSVIPHDVGRRVDTFFKLVQMAVDQCERWKNTLLYIELGAFEHVLSTASAPPALSLQLKRSPMLVSLDVYNGVPSSWSSIGIEVAPHNSLAVLTLQGMVEVASQPGFPPIKTLDAFPSMRQFQFWTPGIFQNSNTAWTIANHSPCLEDFRYSVSPSGDPRMNTNSPFPVVELRESAMARHCLDTYNPRTVARRMPHLLSSSPSEVTLHVMDSGEHFFCPELLDFLERFGRRMVNLELNFLNDSILNTFNDSSLAKVLQPMPRLTGFAIAFHSGHGSPDTLIDALLGSFARQELEALRRLGYLILPINAKAVIRDILRYRNFVETIHNVSREKRMFMLQLNLKCDFMSALSGLQQRAESLLMEDGGIKKCVSANFVVMVNDKNVKA